MDFSVQFGSVESAISELQRIYGQLNTIAETLRGQIASGTAEFEGGTAESFNLAQLQYDRVHAAVATDVQTSSTALRQIEGLYTGNERTYTAAWGG